MGYPSTLVNMVPFLCRTARTSENHVKRIGWRVNGSWLLLVFLTCDASRELTLSIRQILTNTAFGPQHIFDIPWRATHQASCLGGPCLACWDSFRNARYLSQGSKAALKQDMDAWTTNSTSVSSSPHAFEEAHNVLLVQRLVSCPLRKPSLKVSLKQLLVEPMGGQPFVCLVRAVGRKKKNRHPLGLLGGPHSKANPKAAESLYKRLAGSLFCRVDCWSFPVEPPTQMSTNSTNQPRSRLRPNSTRLNLWSFKGETLGWHQIPLAWWF